MDAPRVTVLMPVYNGEAYLRRAVDSVLCQTCRDFELLVVDDGSTDASPRIVSSYADPRIRLVSSAERLTVPNALNKGLALAKGEYIARMDADDESLPDRLERQVRFMNDHRDLALSSGWVRRFGNAGGVMRFPVGCDAVRAYALFDNPFSHPALIFRRSVLEEGGFRYDPDYYLAEDYELFARMMRSRRGNNLPRVLLNYRVHEKGVTQKDWNAMDRQAERVAAGELKHMGIEPGPEMLRFHRQIGRGRSCVLTSREDLTKAERWLIDLGRRNRRAAVHDPGAMEEVLAEIWFRCCFHASALGLSVAWRHLASPLAPIRSASLARAFVIALAALRAKLPAKRKGGPS